MRSLSTTASAPRSSPSSPRTTGMPPPPAQMTMAPEPTSALIVGSSTTANGSGEATTRRHEVPSRRICQPRRAATRWPSSSLYCGPTNLVGCSKAGSSDGHFGLADQADDLAAGQGVLERLEEEVADHPLGLSAEDIEWVGVRQRRVGSALVGQQADLWPVAVGNHYLVVPGQRGQGRHGRLDMLLLDLGHGDLTSLQECVAAYSDHEAHVSPRSWRPLPP